MSTPSGFSINPEQIAQYIASMQRLQADLDAALREFEAGPAKAATTNAALLPTAELRQQYVEVIAALQSRIKQFSGGAESWSTKLQAVVTSYQQIDGVILD